MIEIHILVQNDVLSSQASKFLSVNGLEENESLLVIGSSSTTSLANGL
jgi:hypothetical protein